VDGGEQAQKIAALYFEGYKEALVRYEIERMRQADGAAKGTGAKAASATQNSDSKP